VPHGLLLAVVVAAPLFLGNGDEALAEAVAELLSPVGLLLLPVFGRFPDAVHRVGGSPVGVAFMLLLILALLYYHSSLCPPPRAARTEHGGTAARMEPRSTAGKAPRHRSPFVST